MKKIQKIFSALAHISPGFTMIELLVVIAVIGVLAVAVLSSIDPIEQINKGRDTRKRSNAAQLINAVDRYYAIAELYPWNDATYNGEVADTLPAEEFPNTGNLAGVCTPDGNGFCVIGGPTYAAQAWLTALSETSEVKASFINQLEDTSATNALYMYKPTEAAGGDLYICFSPASKQFQNEAIKGCIQRASILPSGACLNGPYDDTTVWTNELICLP